jgi:hypothetical protein
MAKKKKIKVSKSAPQVKKSPSEFKTPSIISKYPMLWLAILLVILLSIVYAKNIYLGKPFLGSDQLRASMCYKTYITDALDRGIYPLWTPYIFSGMPSYASLSSMPRVNIIDSVINNTLLILSDNDFIRIFLNIALLGVLMFLLLRRYKLSNGVALFGALAIVLIPQFTAFGVHAHNTKLLSLVLIPLILYLIDQLFEKKNLLFLALTALALGFQLFRAHIQVCYYTYMLIGFYFLFYAVFEYEQTQKWSSILKSGGLLAGAIVIALALSSVISLSIYEYSHYSIRGGGPAGGLDFDYATGWSFSPLETLTFLVPGFVGFGGQSYWGPMTMNDYPLYFSVLVLFLAGFAFILKRNRLVWLFSFVALFSLIVSFGRNFPLLYKPMFNWLPFFNKLRIPSMIHILIAISMVILAAIGIQGIIELFNQKDKKLKEKRQKSILIYAAAFIGFCGLIFLFLVFGKNAYVQMAAGTDKIQMYLARGYQLRQISQAVIEPAYALAQTDAFKMMVLLLLGFGAIYGFLKQILNQGMLVAILCTIVVVDLWWVDAKIINNKLKDNRRARISSSEAHFRATPIVSYLKQQQKDDIFRIYPWDNHDYNWYQHHLIPSVYGYNAAKLRIYQEMLEAFRLQPGVPINAHSFKMLNMLNAKYLTSPKEVPGYEIVPGFENHGSKLMVSEYTLPRAFFVSRDTVYQKPAHPTQAEYEAHRDKIFNYMKTPHFDPAEMAILEEEPPFPIETSEDNRMEIDKYDIHQVELTTQVEKPALLVLSEIYYPAGWKAFVDGQETKIYKTNYILRSIFLQPGTHKIKFVFEPFMFGLGLWISLGTLILLLAVIGISVMSQRKLRNDAANS